MKLPFHTVLWVLGAALLTGCASPLLRDYTYTGDGRYRETTLNFYGKIIPGFEISLPEFSLAEAHSSAYRLVNLPVIPGDDANIPSAYIAVDYADSGEMRKYADFSVRREFKLATPGFELPWAGIMTVSLSDAKGEKIWETRDRMEDMAMTGSGALPRNRGGLASRQMGPMGWKIPRQTGAEFRLHIDYRPDPGRSQLPRKAHMVIRAGGSL